MRNTQCAQALFMTKHTTRLLCAELLGNRLLGRQLVSTLGLDTGITATLDGDIATCWADAEVGELLGEKGCRGDGGVGGG